MSSDGSAVPSPAAREGGDVKLDKQKRQENASTGVSAATMRALSARIFAFYFRAPVKAFFRARVEYVFVSTTFPQCRLHPADYSVTATWATRARSIQQSRVVDHGHGECPRQQYLRTQYDNMAGASSQTMCFLHYSRTRRLELFCTRAILTCWPYYTNPPPERRRGRTRHQA